MFGYDHRRAAEGAANTFTFLLPNSALQEMKTVAVLTDVVRINKDEYQYKKYKSN